MKKQNIHDRLITRTSLRDRWDNPSVRTLQRMEKRGELTPILVAGKIHYRLSAILELERERETAA